MNEVTRVQPRIFSVIALMLVGFALPVFAAGELEPVRLQLKWQHQFQFAGYYAAVEKGFYAEAGFDTQLIEFSGGTDLYEPVLSGEAEFGLADSSIVVKRMQGYPVVVLSTIFQHSPLVLITLKDSGVLSPYELIGKRVMFQEGADDAAIQAMLTTLGIRPADYQLVPHNFDNFALLDEELNVDAMSAYLSNQPFLYRERGLDVQIISPANYGIDFYGDLLYTSESYLKANPERVLAFRQATLRGWQYALDHKDEVIGWLQDRYPSNKSDAALRFDANTIEQMVAPNFVALGSLNPARFSRIAEIYKQLNLAPENGDLTGLTVDEYLQSESQAASYWVRLIAVVAAILSLIVGVMSLVLYSLRRTVKSRTAELNQANKDLEHQLVLTDRYVLSAVVDRHGRFLSTSSAFCDATGYPKSELSGMTSIDVVAPSMHSHRETIIERVLQGESWQGEMLFRRKDGSDLWVYLYVDPMRDSQGQINCYRSTGIDITEKKLIQRLSETDTLTGVANRSKLDKALAIEWARYQRYRHPMALILFDIDHFKLINDQYGHLSGDKVLVRVARETEALLRRLDILGRWGGEEFMIILPETDREAAALVAEKLRVSIEQINDLDMHTITASFGVATTSDQIAGTEELIHQADEAMYRAKQAGRNQVMLAP